ncbi:MAG: GHKL domain-containing protein [Candidatus Saganbacteria bacterium]|nr:GHKL domain-containing protein [Candidatus Saganbacteria bacterium]
MTKRKVAYSVLTALLTGLFISLILLGDYFARGMIGYSSIWISILAVFVIALLFQPLRDLVQSLMDRIFFRQLYNYQRILQKYSHALAQPITDLNRFARIAPYLLTKSVKISGASVMVLDREHHNYIVRAGEKDARELIGTALLDDSPLVSELVKRKRELSVEEVKDKIKSGEDRVRWEAILSEMRRLKAVLVIPSISESQYFQKPTLLATINLCQKLSKQPYSKEDIEFLDTLANQATVTIEYAFIFEEFKKAQETLVRSEKLAAIGTTTAGVAHELKNPLTYLSAVAQVLPKKWDDKEFRQSLNQMLPAEIQRMQLIIEGLLDYSRSRELALKPLNVSEVLDKAIALLAYEVRKFKIDVDTSYQHSKNANADSNRLMQVFMNLIANAVQAMEGNGGLLSIRTSDTDNQVVICISDTGRGIPANKINRIFDSFFTTKDGGTGLGLSISKKIVEEHHGSISVESTEGRGTTFTVRLPAV